MLDLRLRQIPVPLLIGIIALLGSSAFVVSKPTTDWSLLRNSLLQAPVGIIYSYPPHTVMFLPHALLPERLSLVANTTLLFGTLVALLWKYDGTLLAMLVALCNPATLLAIWLSQLDWIPALALLLPAPLAGIALAAKPQTMLGVGILWLRRRSWIAIGFAIGAFMAGIAIHGFWWQGVTLPDDAWAWNIAIFPFGLPVAAWLSWRCWRNSERGELWAVCIAPLASPYFALYSLAPALAVICSKDRRIGIWLVLALWYLFFYTLSRESGAALVN